MKKFLFLLVLPFIFVSCDQNNHDHKKECSKKSRCCTYAKEVNKDESIQAATEEDAVLDKQEENFTAEEENLDDDSVVEANDTVEEEMSDMKETAKVVDVNENEIVENITE